jgi:hypothetical protein
VVFCINDDNPTFDLAKVAVTTCLANTELEPVCLFYSQDQHKLEWLTAKGVKVIPFQKTYGNLV